MRFYRIGDKVVSPREARRPGRRTSSRRARRGATQEEAARAHGVQRTFVSFLETLGEVRRGKRVALVGFPVANVDEVRARRRRATRSSSACVLSQAEREGLEARPGRRACSTSCSRRSPS